MQRLLRLLTTTLDFALDVRRISPLSLVLGLSTAMLNMGNQIRKSCMTKSCERDVHRRAQVRVPHAAQQREQCAHNRRGGRGVRVRLLLYHVGAGRPPRARPLVAARKLSPRAQSRPLPALLLQVLLSSATASFLSLLYQSAVSARMLLLPSDGQPMGHMELLSIRRQSCCLLLSQPAPVVDTGLLRSHGLRHAPCVPPSRQTWVSVGRQALWCSVAGLPSAPEHQRPCVVPSACNYEFPADRVH